MEDGKKSKMDEIYHKLKQMDLCGRAAVDKAVFWYFSIQV